MSHNLPLRHVTFLHLKDIFRHIKQLLLSAIKHFVPESDVLKNYSQDYQEHWYGYLKHLVSDDFGDPLTFPQALLAYTHRVDKLL